MEHLNYCRQMVKQFIKNARDSRNSKSNIDYLYHFIDLANTSEKFILPDGGRILDNYDLRGIDFSEPLRLPFPRIAIEFTRNKFANLETNQTRQPRKALIFARECDEKIVFSLPVWFDDAKMWAPLPEASISKINYLDYRTVDKNGNPALKIKVDGSIPGNDYIDEVGAVFSLLEALNCFNVRIASSHAKKPKKLKCAIPFDDYHVLVLGAKNNNIVRQGSFETHRSPREHLRRGHIRRLKNGKKTWVNSTIVCAGRGRGRITKDYALCSAT